MNETGAGRLTGSPSRGGDKEIRKISPNLSLRLSPERRFSPNRRGGSPLRGSNSFNDSGNFVPGSTTNMRPYVDNDREEKDKSNASDIYSGNYLDAYSVSNLLQGIYGQAG